MSKRHQSHRRRAYGRRQHELHERYVRGRAWDELDIRVEDVRDPDILTAFESVVRSDGSRAPFFDLLAPRSRWAPEAT